LAVAPDAGTGHVNGVPRILIAGHVTWDVREGREVLGGSVAYGALAARTLGWRAGVLTSAGPEFDPARDLPGVEVFVCRAAATTRFRNIYQEDGTRRQVLVSRSAPVEPSVLPEEWRAPEALLLAGVAGELGPGMARGFEAEVVGVAAQGFLREFDADGEVAARDAWPGAARDLEGAHVLFLSEHDMPQAERHARELLSLVPVVALTRGWRGLRLFTREGVHEVAALPRPEVDPTGAGDVFAAAFLLRYHESADLIAAAAFAACAASCAVEGVGVSSLGDREEVQRRLVLRERLVEDGEWEE
jgi:sugar/nucleoside kinase (ribokinase family)